MGPKVPAGDVAVVRCLAAELLEQFEKAVSDGARWEAVRLIFVSPAFDGLCARLRSQWSWLPPGDVNQAVSEAFEALYVALGTTTTIEDPVLWLAGVARHKAADIMRSREREELRGGLLMPDEPGARAGLLADNDNRRAELARLARGLLPRLGSANVQAVMAFYIDAVENGVTSVGYQEIADAIAADKDNVKTWAHRGFRRIARLAAAEGLASENFELLPRELEFFDDEDNVEEEM